MTYLRHTNCWSGPSSFPTSHQMNPTWGRCLECRWKSTASWARERWRWSYKTAWRLSGTAVSTQRDSSVLPAVLLKSSSSKYKWFLQLLISRHYENHFSQLVFSRIVLIPLSYLPLTFPHSGLPYNYALLLYLHIIFVSFQLYNWFMSPLEFVQCTSEEREGPRPAHSGRVSEEVPPWAAWTHPHLWAVRRVHVLRPVSRTTKGGEFQILLLNLCRLADTSTTLQKMKDLLSQLPPSHNATLK